MDNELEKLHHDVKISLANHEILMRDVKDIKYVLVGNEMNNARGLVRDFQDHRIETKEAIDKLEERVTKNEEYQANMKGGVKVIAFITTSVVVVWLTGFINWLIKNFH